MGNNHIYPARTLITLRTPLQLIPKDWLDMIEPRIRRPEGTSCWLWDGAVDFEGEPIITAKNLVTGSRGTRRVKRIVADMFWDIDESVHVLHACKNNNCLFPDHFYVTRTHWKHEDRHDIINKRATRIKRWGERGQ